MRRTAWKKIHIRTWAWCFFTLLIYDRCHSATCEPSLKRSTCLDPKEIKINKSNMSGISSFLCQAKPFFFNLTWICEWSWLPFSGMFWWIRYLLLQQKRSLAKQRWGREGKTKMNARRRKAEFAAEPWDEPEVVRDRATGNLLSMAAGAGGSSHTLMSIGSEGTTQSSSYV